MRIWPSKEYIPLYCIKADRGIRVVDVSDFYPVDYEGEKEDLFHSYTNDYDKVNELANAIAESVSENKTLRFTTRDYSLAISPKGFIVNRVPLVIACLRRTYYDSGLDINDKANWYYILNTSHSSAKFASRFFTGNKISKRMVIDMSFSGIVKEFGGVSPEFEDYLDDRKELAVKEWLESLKVVQRFV